MARRRKTRDRARSIQQTVEADPFRDFEGGTAELYAAKIALFVRTHTREFFIGLGVFAALIAILSVFLVWRETVEEESIAEYNAIMRDLGGAGGFGATTAALDQLNEYEENFTHERARLRAAVQKVHYLSESGDLTGAAESAFFIAETVSTAELKAHYYLHAGFLFEEAEELERAEESYRLCAEFLLGEGDALRATALLGQARVLFLLDSSDRAREVARQVFEIEEGADIQRLHAETTALLLKYPE